MSLNVQTKFVRRFSKSGFVILCKKPPSLPRLLFMQHTHKAKLAHRLLPKDRVLFHHLNPPPNLDPNAAAASRRSMILDFFWLWYLETSTQQGGIIISFLLLPRCFFLIIKWAHILLPSLSLSPFSRQAPAVCFCDFLVNTSYHTQAFLDNSDSQGKVYLSNSSPGRIHDFLKVRP